jgi:hypothetical protein
MENHAVACDQMKRKARVLEKVLEMVRFISLPGTKGSPLGYRGLARCVGTN